MRFLLSVVVLVSSIALGQPAQPPRPAAQGVQRSPAAQAVLAYLTDLPNRADNRIIAGQFGFYGDAEDPDLVNEVLQQIVTKSGGKQIGMTGVDYNSEFYRRTNSYQDTNAWVIARWREGMLITVSWHAPNPFVAGSTGASEESNWPSVRALLTPGNANYTRWRAALKAVADGLTELRDAGVVVIWRPFHEMNGAWFWWHQQTQADFRDLWINMFDYFTNTRGLNNLLWGYSPNFAWDQWAKQVDYYYPGDAYVDIVGLDFYGPRNMDVMELDKYESYKDLVALNKPIGLFEFGPSPANGSGWQDTPYDYSRLPRDIRAKYPKLVFFQAWEWLWTIARHANQIGLMNDPWIITLDEMPHFDGGVVLPTTVPGTPGPTVTYTPSPTSTISTPMPSVTPMPSATPRPTRTKVPTVSPTLNPTVVPTQAPTVQKGWKIVIEIKFEYIQ